MGLKDTLKIDIFEISCQCHSERFREGQISVGEVPVGKWYKQFPKFTLAGEGAVPKTFLTPGMIPHGTEVQ